MVRVSRVPGQTSRLPLVERRILCMSFDVHLLAKDDLQTGKFY
jgi:hypothetical protein